VLFVAQLGICTRKTDRLRDRRGVVHIA